MWLLIFTISHRRVKRSSPATAVWTAESGGGIATRRNVGHKAFIGHSFPYRHRSFSTLYYWPYYSLGKRKSCTADLDILRP